MHTKHQKQDEFENTREQKQSSSFMQEHDREGMTKQPKCLA